MDASQHILIETLLKEGFENKLISSEASCNVRVIQRDSLKEAAVQNAHPDQTVWDVVAILYDLWKISSVIS